MQIILLADVKGVGKKGEAVTASEGYAKNFLIPRKLGIEANASNLNDLKLKQKSEEKRKAEELQAAQELKALIETKTVEIAVKTGGNGKLFGSVTSKEIAEALEEGTGIKIDKKKIVLIDQIKMVGESSLPVKLHPKVTAELKVIIKEI